MGVGAKAGKLRLGLTLIGAAVVAMLLLAAPASAAKTHLFLETFGSAAQPEFHGSTALAVDQSNGDLLVVDSGEGAKTLSRFKPNGEPDPFSALGTNTIDAKKGPGGKACAEEPSSCDQTPQNGFSFGGSVDGEAQIAVDNSGTATDGDIYVTQGYKETGNLVDIFAADGHYLGQLTAAGATKFGTTGSFPFSPVGVAVDGAGNLYLGGGYDDRIYKFEQPASPHNPLANADGTTLSTTTGSVWSLVVGAGPSAGALFAIVHDPDNFQIASLVKFNAASGALEGNVGSGNDRLVAVDPSTGGPYTLFGALSVNNSWFGTGLTEFTASGSLVSTTDVLGRGIAIDGTTGRIYISSARSGGGLPSADVRVLGPVVTVPEVVSGSYEVTGDTSVRVKGTVNPDGQALSECSFEYGLTPPPFGSPYEHSAPCEAPDAAEVGSGAGPVAVHADLTGLGKETTYHYRLVATNPNAALYPKDPHAIARGEDQTFKTPSKPGIKALWATNVIVTEATLKATVNPENSPTTYRFEWGLDSSYGNSSAEFNLGSDGADHTVGFNLSGLEPATTYHYRLVAANGIGISEADDHHFTTFAVPVPPGAECENGTSRLGPGAFLPDCRAYEMVSPVDKDGGDIRVVDRDGELAVLEQSSVSGEKLAYGSFRSFGGALSAPTTSQYIAQRIEGAEWQTHPINPPSSRSLIGAASSVDKEFWAFSPDLCQAWYRNLYDPPLAEGALPGVLNLYLRTDRLCGEERYEALAPITTPADIDLEGVSADGSHAVVRMLHSVPGGFAEQIFLATPAGPQLICVLPNGRPQLACQMGAGRAYAPGTISADGSRIFWSSGTDILEGHIYLRYNAGQPESARLHGAATGKGNLIGPAAGKGNVASGSELVKGAKAESGAFAAGQEISAASGGIPAKATIKEIKETSPGVFTLTLSAKATKNAPGDTLTGAASETVGGIVTESGAFAVGQEVSAANEGIPAGATIVSCSPSCGPAATSLTLSAKATKSGTATEIVGSSECTEAATKACTIPVSKGAEEAAGTNEALFWGAAEDGTKAILTARTGPEQSQNNLYSFEPDGEATELLAEGVYGVMGYSTDAERIYFVSSKVLSAEPNSVGDKAQVGKPNLYLYEAGGAIEYIATVADGDLERLDISARQEYNRFTARVSPDAARAVFESVAPLTGYDKTEVAATDCGSSANSTDPCREIYRYDAEANELLCVSCNPSGGRPSGNSSIPLFLTPMHGARVLSDDGDRVYFQSGDALTVRDTNGQVDVYQWEAPGAGPPGAECAPQLPTFNAENGGCVDLISSGQSHIDSRFAEASPSGEDVFIATASSLLPQDPGGVDIYDARVNGGLPIPAGPAPGCEGEACQSPVEAPNDPTPASSSFEGAGNVVEEAPPARRPCAKGKVKRHGKCVAKKHKKAAKGAKRNRRAGR